MDEARKVLRELAACDGQRLRAVLAADAASSSELDRETRALVQLAALMVGDAGTVSVRWAADIAAVAGADDATLVGVLIAAASASGAVQTVKSAPRLALALDGDVEVEGWDGTRGSGADSRLSGLVRGRSGRRSCPT
jgi:hypothetical protein